MTLLEVKELTVAYPVAVGLSAFFSRRYLVAVDHVSFSLPEGSTLALVGESGCGKSSTGLAILGLLDHVKGEILFQGKNVLRMRGREIREFRRRAQIVLQDPYESLNPKMRVRTIVGEPLAIHRRRGEITHLKKALELAGLSPPEYFLDKYPHELSGGERQRVAIAAAVVLEPKLLVLDEPVSNLDVSIKAGIMNLFRDLQDTLGLSYLFITHDLADAFFLSDEVAVMYLGVTVEKGKTEEVLSYPFHPYTKALLSVAPGSGREKLILAGDVPDPLHPPPGCRFHPRCPRARGRCSEEIPPEVEAAPGHRVRCFYTGV
ncbi:ABC transporter ATP-binding protein [Candidatus Bipolaricaulota sp. J31]